jgi:hypothetical protein
VQEAFQRHGCGVPKELLNELVVDDIHGQECDARLTQIVEADVAEDVFRSLTLGAHHVTVHDGGFDTTERATCGNSRQPPAIESA